MELAPLRQGASMLTDFYAVILGVRSVAVYHVVSHDWQRNGHPSAIREYVRYDPGCLYSGHVASSVNDRLGVGSCIAVGQLLMMFEPDYSREVDFRDPNKIDLRYLGGRSGPVVALFEAKGEAMVCIREHSDLEPSDQRWKHSTKRILDLIGDDHPTFVVWEGENQTLFPSVAKEE